MNAEFIEALNALEKEKGISKDVLLSAVESALIFAYKRNYNSQGNVRAEVDGKTGEMHIYASKTVVETVENPTVEISVAQARKVNPLYDVGDVIEEEADTRKFGRIAAQTAKQVVVQRIREAERGNIYDEYVEKENEILTAIVQRVEKGNAFVELGKTDGILTQNEMIPGESYEQNQRIKVYVLEVRKDNKGPQVLVSRTHPGLVKRLFELEVPEIMSGVVQIKSIAREAGFRTKIAVWSSDPQVDAVGACVGPRASGWSASSASSTGKRSTSWNGIWTAPSISPNPCLRPRCSWSISTKKKRPPRSSCRITSCLWPSARKGRTPAWPPSSPAGK